MDAPREAAYQCVRGVVHDDAYANLVLPAIITRFKLSGRDAAFATELAYGALRMRGLYDAIVSSASRRDALGLDEPVRLALWLGVHQALAMRVPPHAAVSQTVDLARRHGGPRVAPFVNAVMRRVTERSREDWLTLVAPTATRADLAVRHSHPQWVVGELQAALAADGRAGELEQLLEADNAAPSVTLVARPGLVDRDELPATATRWSPWGATLVSGDPGAVPAVAEGLAAVQDEGSQLVAGALVAHRGVRPGERWLDMCAGPGGKAALLGALAAQRGATLDANELHTHRVELVHQAVRALPPGAVRVVQGDARTLAGMRTNGGGDAHGNGGDSAGGSTNGSTNGSNTNGGGNGYTRAGLYDRILLDAPCTGLGALRRRPEARWRRQPEDIPELVALQRDLLAAAAVLLRPATPENSTGPHQPGGLLAYVTCSPLLAETRLVNDLPGGLTLIDARPALASLTDTNRDAWGKGPHVQLWPHAHGTDAMFLALLERQAAEPVDASQ